MYYIVYAANENDEGAERPLKGHVVLSNLCM